MKIKNLEKLGYKLGNVSKMPAFSWGISAFDCKVGSKLAKIKGTTCYNCYAMKGFYSFKPVKFSHRKRLKVMSNEYYVSGMTHMLKLKYKRLPKEKRYFRWFDSGDLQSVEMLKKICDIAWRTIDIKHWLPTREYKIVDAFIKKYGEVYIPDNLTIRLSAVKVNGKPPTFWKYTSTVHTKEKKWIGKNCPAITSGTHKCGDCRLCWNKSEKNISYEQH